MFLSKDLKLLTSSMFLHIPCVREQDAPLAQFPNVYMHIFHSIRVNDSYVWNIINLLHVLSVNLMLRNLQGNILFHKVMIFCDNLYTVTKWSRLSTFLSVYYVLGEDRGLCEILDYRRNATPSSISWHTLFRN